MAKSRYVCDLCTALFLRRIWDYGGVGEENELVVTRDVGCRDVGQDFSLRQYAFLLVEYGSKYIIRVYQSLHEDVCPTLAHKFYGTNGGIVAINADCLRKALGFCTFDCVACAIVVSTDDSDAFAHSLLAEMLSKLQKTMYAFHVLDYKNVISTAKIVIIL